MPQLTLTALLAAPLRDTHGRRVRVVDVIVALGEPHPTVTGLVVQRRGGPLGLLAPAELLSTGAPVADELPAPPDPDAPGLAYLRRDVRDALLIDVADRRLTRADELILAHDADRMELLAAEVGPGALLRRLARGAPGPAERLDWAMVVFLRGDPALALSGSELPIAKLQPVEIASLSEQLPYLHAAELLASLPSPLAADTLEALPLERQLQLLDALGEERSLTLLALIAPDNLADLCGELEPAAVQRWLNRLPPAQARQATELLRYPADSVGGAMTNAVVRAPAALTVAEAREQLRDQLRDPDFVYFVYVVDGPASERLQGVLTLRELLVADDNCPLETLMRRDLLALDPLEPAKRAARRLLASQLAALPVVARDGRLLGAMTVDRAVQLVAPEAWRAEAPRMFS